jgi:hypothetical protein
MINHIEVFVEMARCKKKKLESEEKKKPTIKTL